MNIRRAYLKVQKWFWNLLLTIRNKQFKQSGVSGFSNVIVSLTSFPARIDIVYLTIETILKQTYKPKKVILWLSKDQITEDQIPETLLRQKERGLDIRFVDGDIRAYKKLYYAVKEFKDEYILTADDDVYYPEWWIERILNKKEEFPDKVICYRAHMMKKEGPRTLASYSDWKKASIDIPDFNIFPVGVSGVLYQSSFFDKEFERKEIFMDICPSNDDIWFKAMTLKNNVDCVQVYPKVTIFQTIEGSQEESLFQVNVVGKQNDAQLKAVFDKYDLYGKISQF